MATKVKDNTLGRQIRGADFQEFSIAETSYAPGARLAPHDHDFTYLSLVLRGGFEESVGRYTELARSASVVVMPRGVTHSECIGPNGARSVTIALKGRFLDNESHVRQFERWRWFHCGVVSRTMIRAYREYLLADVGSDCEASDFLLELLGAIGGERDLKLGSSRKCVSDTLAVLHARGNRGVRLAELATELGKDPAYLARAFRRQMGCTMSEYRRRVWVREAAHLLASTNAPLTNIAQTAGFADQSHLCRVFKAQLGLTPQTYRRLARAG
jgi:AraC family transcriptional regulator